MNSSDLKKMFVYLRRAYTSKESREFLTRFYPENAIEIQELKMSEMTTPPNAAKSTKRVTNMDRARAIYAASTDKSRKTIIQLFQDQIDGMGQATASTYFYQVSPNRVKRTPNIVRAREIFGAAPEKTRKALMPEFMKLGMNENVASTYYYNCKRYFDDLGKAKIAGEDIPRPANVNMNSTSGVLGGVDTARSPRLAKQDVISSISGPVAGPSKAPAPATPTNSASGMGLPTLP